MTNSATHLLALDQCGLELGAPHLRTTRKRRVDAAHVDAAALPSDSLRFIGWDPQAVEARYEGLDPMSAYELEAVFLCERDVDRVLSVSSRELELHPPVALARGVATIVRFALPAAALRDGTLDIRFERLRGPDAVVSELRLFSSAPPAPILTVVGDSRGGLIGSVAMPDSTAVAGALVRVSGEAAAFDVTSDTRGLFAVPLADRLPPGRDGMVTLSTGSGGQASEVRIDTRTIARGLRELPPAADRLDLSGEWTYHGGPAGGARPEVSAGSVARVPGHIVYDSLVPVDGIGTLERTFEVPAAWTGRAVFLRCDGAYGRAEVFVNGRLAGVHGSGATSFDVDVTRFIRPGQNAVAVTLTEFTPHSVLDDMSWYAHMSLLGIWRDIFLFAVPRLHLGQLAIDADWDARRASGALTLGVNVINLDEAPGSYNLAVVVRDRHGRTVHRSKRRGTVGAGEAVRETIATGALDVQPWSAEEPRLHDLELTLAADGATPLTVQRRIGFRRVETRAGELLVNGAPIRIRGVNRHDSRLLKGRALSAEDMREDVVNLHRANVNVIRTSHYPASPHLLDACDEIGMFVLEQPPICFSGGFDDHHWTRTNEAVNLIPYVLEVTAETVRRDLGHPSVIVWDLANESRWGAAFDAQLALVRAIDPSRPTIFSFDLNELGPENELVGRPAAERPDLRSYHYPGWDRTWQEDLEWLGSHDQPVILDEYAPVFAPCLRGPGEAFGLAIDPGIRDYWGAGYQPFVAAALGERGVIGGLIWGGFGEVFAIPLDLTIGEGPWAHLPVADYVRTRDHYPAEPGVFRRGDGDWGVFDAWNRPRPELWHVHEMYSPISVAATDIGPERAVVTLANAFSHRSFDGLDVRVSGGDVKGTSAMTARPGETAELVVRRGPSADVVRIECWHPEGWLVAAFEWPWPGAGPSARDVVLDRAEEVELSIADQGSLAIFAGGRHWLLDWPDVHVLDVDMPHVPVPVARADRSGAVALGPAEVRAAIDSRDWQGSISARLEGRTVVFEYVCSYVGVRPFNAKEVGLTLRPSPELSDLWWQRIGEWTVYPANHIGRPRGYSEGRAGSNSTLDPAPTWEADSTAAGSNDYRSVKRRILAAGATDGMRSLSVLSDGTQHVRAELVDGAPVLHVLDWYGGVRTLEGNHPIWSAYFGSGLPIAAGTTLLGRIVLAVGEAALARDGEVVRSRSAP